MGLKDTISTWSKRLKFDSHHSMERFGVVAGAMALTGVIVLATTASTAATVDRGVLSDTAVWTASFTTSKTEQGGTVKGVYVSPNKTRALVVLSFGKDARISYSAADYEAFLLGSDKNLGVDKVSTQGIEAEIYTFGSTGYIGVLLKADEPFKEQVLNLTMRANKELTVGEGQKATTDGLDESTIAKDAAADASFVKYDQWRVYVNPGATQAQRLDGLTDTSFDPTPAFYQLAVKSKEDDARVALDNQLLDLRSGLTQIDAYSRDLVQTKVDGLFLQAPKVPAVIAGDTVTGKSANENGNKGSTLELHTTTVVPGGYNFDWRSGNVLDGYLKGLVKPGESYVTFLNDHNKASMADESDESGSGVGGMSWVLSDGTDLTQDYRAGDSAMRPLTTVMNNLSQAYQSYYTAKKVYQTKQREALLNLDVEVREVEENTTINDNENVVTVYE